MVANIREGIYQQFHKFQETRRLKQTIDIYENNFNVKFVASDIRTYTWRVEGTTR